MKYRATIIMAAITFLLLPFVVHSEKSAVKDAEPPISTEAFHITRRDGVKSIAQLIREQSTGSPTPALSIKAFSVYVDAHAGDLTLANVQGFQPPGFELSIKAGDDKRVLTTRVAALKGIQALEFFPVKTDSVCNFLIVFEFYPD